MRTYRGTESIMPSVTARWPTVDLTPTRGWYGDVNCGNHSRYQVACFVVITDHSCLLVAVERKGCATFSEWASWEYVAERFGMVKTDACQIADFVNTQLLSLGWIDVDSMQGTYEAACCVENNPEFKSYTPPYPSVCCVGVCENNVIKGAVVCKEHLPPQETSES